MFSATVASLVFSAAVSRAAGPPGGPSDAAPANGFLVSPNGFVQIGVNPGGELDAPTPVGFVGIGYNFTGQGGRSGFQDALTPGCPCEAWGLSANGQAGQIGQNTGNQNISVGASTSTASGFTSNAALTSLPGLTIAQSYTLGTETATGALFKDTVTITNGTGATLTDVRYARAMDWDVPSTEFNEYVTHKGTTTTRALLRSTDDGFANANPITALGEGGIIGPINADGTTGPADHGSLFVFGLGELAAGASYSFTIFYGAGADEANALALLGRVGPELYSLGQSNVGGVRSVELPTYIFAFNGVGGSVVVPPTGVPEPTGWGLLGVGRVGAGLVRRMRRWA